MSKPTMSLFPTSVLVQHSYENFHLPYDNQQIDMHGRKNAVGGISHQSDSLLQKDSSLHSFEHSFATFLELVRMTKLSYFVNNEFVFKLLFEWPLSRYFILILNKEIQGIQLVDKMLAWLHWAFDFT